jgi:hypothetical protein
MSLVIDALDVTLKELFVRRVTQLRLPAPPVTAAQVGFQPPDREWRTVVTGLGTRRALNIYLVDVRENRRLRSNERFAEHQSGIVVETTAPLRLDCHYLITAWSPATEGAGKTLAEHELLSEVVAVLGAVPELVPRAVFTPGGPPALFPSGMLDSVLPVSLLPTDGFAKLAEFWGTMQGQNHPWKPAVYLVVTVPVALDRHVAGVEVTTVTTEFGGVDGGRETSIQVAGVVRDGSITPPVPIDRAWVRLEATGGSVIDSTSTYEFGEFTFLGLIPGSYRLQARANGRNAPPPLLITVPSATGRYDLQLT